MSLYYLVPLLFILTLVLYQDVKYRTIHVFLPCMIFILGIIINYVSAELVLKDVLLNMGFIILNILGLILYFSIKKRTFFNPLDNVIGLGDLVFFIALTPFFELRPFIVFFISGLVFSLVIHMLSKNIKNKTIPLAGYLALFLVLNIIAEKVIGVSLMN